MSLEGPCVLIFSRQDLPVLDRSAAWGTVADGAYIVSGAEEDPDVVLIGTGSEVDLAVRAATLLAEQGLRARVVSMPSWELFAQRDDAPIANGSSARLEHLASPSRRASLWAGSASSASVAPSSVSTVTARPVRAVQS